MHQEAARKTVSKEELEEKALVSLARVRKSSFAVSKLNAKPDTITDCL